MMRNKWCLVLVMVLACGCEEPAAPRPLRHVIPDLVSIPGGAFKGVRLPCDLRPGEEASSEIGLVTLHVDSFEIDRTNVTCEAYQECVDAGACAPLKGEVEHISSLGSEHAGCDEGLATVRRRDAGKYCSFIGGRLPSHLEIQRAIRGEAGWRYPDGGKDPVECASRTSHDRNFPRCRYRSKDGVEYLLNSYGMQEHLGDRSCTPHSGLKQTTRVYWVVNDDAIWSFRTSYPNLLGYFRCSYPSGIVLPRVFKYTPSPSIPADSQRPDEPAASQ